MNPEFDRQGSAVCLFWPRGGKHDEAPTDRKTSNLRAWLGTTGTPSALFKGRKWEPVGPTKLTATRAKRKTNLGGCGKNHDLSCANQRACLVSLRTEVSQIEES